MEKIEYWKDILNFEGLYEVSNFGNVKSVERVVKYQDGRTGTYKGRIMKSRIGTSGYSYITLSKDGKRYDKAIHRLVAEAFIPNPDNLPCINHKDEKKVNNFVYVNPDGTVDFEKSNLEWCTYSYNNRYGIGNIQRTESKIKTWRIKKAA